MQRKASLARKQKEKNFENMCTFIANSLNVCLTLMKRKKSFLNLSMCALKFCVVIFAFWKDLQKNAFYQNLI
jgi:hypothetical protein